MKGGKYIKKVFNNYKSSIILLLSIILGSIFGIIFKDKMSVLSPFGDLFLNMLLVIIIPLLFLTISTSIGKMKQPKRIGKILLSTLVIFVITSLISVFIGLFVTKTFRLINPNSISVINGVVDSSDKVNFLERTINTISVNDFSKLLTKDNMIALIVFSILFGLSINISKDKSKKVLEVLESFSNVINSFIKIVMYYAPIGLFCYSASLVGTLGSSIIFGYTKTFILYCIASLFVYFIVYSLYVYICGGKKQLKLYWKNIIAPSVTALSTCSSAACIPVNTTYTKKMGVSDDIADTTIPLGTSFHKDGSIIGSVFKIMFLVYLFNSSISTSKIIIIALLATLLVTAVPIGGGTISEALIVTMLGFNPSCILMLTIIATIIDAPATLLNVVGDSASSIMVSRIVDGKKRLGANS